MIHAQRPITHIPEHLTPQPPQLVGLVFKSDSQPLAVFPSQSPRAISHVPVLQRPMRHAGVPPRLGHAMPQAPQLAGLVLRFVSQPLVAIPSQSAVPTAHEGATHDPARQIIPAAHATPQPPQLVGFTSTSTHPIEHGVRVRSAHAHRLEAHR